MTGGRDSRNFRARHGGPLSDAHRDDLVRLRRARLSIGVGSAWEWWKPLRGTKPVVLHESEFIPLSQVRSGGI